MHCGILVFIKALAQICWAFQCARARARPLIAHRAHSVCILTLILSHSYRMQHFFLTFLFYCAIIIDAPFVFIPFHCILFYSIRCDSILFLMSFVFPCIDIVLCLCCCCCFLLQPVLLLFHRHTTFCPIKRRKRLIIFSRMFWLHFNAVCSPSSRARTHTHID